MGRDDSQALQRHPVLDVVLRLGYRKGGRRLMGMAALNFDTGGMRP